MAAITLLGTSHIAKQSVQQIQSTVADLQPTIVAVELDRKRLYALLHEQRTSLRLSDIRRIGLQGFLFAWIGGIVQRKLGASVGVLPGADMLSAIKIAQQQGAQVALIDQDIEITLRRFSAKLSWRERGRFVWDLLRGLLFGKRELRRYGLGNIDLRKVPSHELIQKMIGIIRTRYPNIYQVLVHERNVVMTHRLRHIATQHPDAKILAVVGAGHVEGMRELLRVTESI